MLCVTLTISSGYRSLIYPCITIKIGGHRRLSQSTHEICRPTYNRSQTKRLSAILNLQNFDTSITVRVNRTINVGDNPKGDFQYGGRPPS